MGKDFKSETYKVDESTTDTILWLMQHQDIFDSFHRFAGRPRRLERRLRTTDQPEHQRQAVLLVASELVRIGHASGQLVQARQSSWSAATPPRLRWTSRTRWCRPRSRRGTPLHDARAGYVRHMAQEPSLIAAARWLSQEALQ